jgi:hypothetical protein
MDSTYRSAHRFKIFTIFLVILIAYQYSDCSHAFCLKWQILYDVKQLLNVLLISISLAYIFISTLFLSTFLCPHFKLENLENVVLRI